MVASRQTRLKLKKGFHNAPIRYRILTVFQFSEIDKKEIIKGLVKAITPKKSEELLPRPGKPSRWSLLKQTSIGIAGSFEVQILRFRGADVAVFWKRQTSEIIPDPSDPVPEGILEHEDDVWVRLDLFSKSAKQMMKSLQSEFDKIAVIETEVLALNRLVAAKDQTIATLQGQLAKQTKSKKK